MVHLIVELSKYALIILFSVYTYECFAVYIRTKTGKEIQAAGKDFVCDSFYGIFSHICGDRGCIYFYFLSGADNSSCCGTECVQIMLSDGFKTFG